MTGLFSGIIGSLIGAGIQATVGGIPIGENASKALDVLRGGGVPVPPANWFSMESSNEQKSRQAVGQIGQNFTGAMQVLGPCLDIAKGLGNVVCPPSQRTNQNGGASQAELAGIKAPCGPKINNPALLSTGTVTQSGCGCNSEYPFLNNKKSSRIAESTPVMNNCKPMENEYPPSSRIENWKTKKPEIMGDRSPPGHINAGQKKQRLVKIEAGSSVNGKTSRTENLKKGKIDPRERALKADKINNRVGIPKNFKGGFSTVIKDEEGLYKPQIKCEKSVNTEKCKICQAQIKKPIKSGSMSRADLLCYKCSKNQKFSKSSQCKC